MRQRTFFVPVTVMIRVRVLRTEDGEADRATAAIFAKDYGRQIWDTCTQKGDPVRVIHVTTDAYPEEAP